MLERKNMSTMKETYGHCPLLFIAPFPLTCQQAKAGFLNLLHTEKKYSKSG
jgi:hypothetical protein